MELIEADREDLRGSFRASTPGRRQRRRGRAHRVLRRIPGQRPLKVACLRSEELADELTRLAELDHARRLAVLAGRLSWRARRPMVDGVLRETPRARPARSGARGRRRPGSLSSDVIRKQLAGIPPERPAPRAPTPRSPASPPIASGRRSRRCGVAGRRAGGRHVPAPYTPGRLRRGLRRGGTQPLFVECRAPAAVADERARRRTLTRGRPPTRRPRSPRACVRVEHLDEVDAERDIIVRTDREVGHSIDELEAALDARLARSGGG